MRNVMKLEEKLGYIFTDKALMYRALTRKAYAIEKKQEGLEYKDQEIFRTLGDAVIRLVLVDLLIDSGYNTREDITKKKIELERKETLAKIGEELKLDDYIILGAGEKKQKINREPKTLAETFEALIGAIYNDGGFDVSKEVISKIFKNKI